MSDAERPEPTDPRLLELAMRVADDAPVDWEGARVTASDLSETLEHLREIEHLAIAHRRERSERSAAPAEPAFQWGPLAAVEKLGEGGFAEVWRAWDASLAREVALKLRRGDPRSSGASRWLKEAQRLARVKHRNVLQVLGADVHDGRPGLWTELVRGRTLEERLQLEGPCGAAEAALVGMQVCEALAAVHGAGLVHGDVKTRNLMREGSPDADVRLTHPGRIVLMDFGTASEAEPGPETHPLGAAGTPLFAAPELLDGAPASVAGDLYALGVVLYRLVTGRFPVEATSMAELRERLARGESTPLRQLRPDLPPVFIHVVERALESEPGRRFAGAAAMERALAGALAPARETIAGAPSRGRLVLAVLAGAALVGLAWAGVKWVPEWTRPRFHLTSPAPAVAVRHVQAFTDSALVSLYGWSVACPGDLDGDGLADLLVGAPDEAKSSGHVHVLRGRPDGTFAEWYVISGPTQGQFGARVAGLGDLDGDGRPEFAVSAPNENTGGAGAGAVYLYRAADGPGARPAGRLTGRLALEAFGSSIASAGDVNGDGRPDFLVGSVSNSERAPGAGAAYLYLGGPRLPTEPAVRMIGTVAQAQFGASVAGVGDVNGDGVDDYAVGAQFDPSRGTGAGRVAVYFGGRELHDAPDLNLYGRDADCWFGTAICALGDVDGDGFDDFAIGAERDRGLAWRSGRVYVFHGAAQPGAEPALALLGEGDRGILGHSLAAAPNLDGEGHADVVAGEPYLTTSRSIGGGVLMMSVGKGTDALADLRLVGDEENGNFGFAVATLPPEDSLSFGGIVVGSPFAYPGGSIHIYRFSRYAFARPRSDEHWTAGANATVAWLGASPADLDWAPADGGAWHSLARRVGGRERNALTVRVPQDARGGIRLRLRPADPKVRSARLSDRIEVIAAH